MLAIFKKWTAKRAALSFFSIFLMAGIYLGVEQKNGNFHTVIDNELYRSGQLTPAQLSHYQQKYKIKTVINLRGPNMDKDWYVQELAESRRLGVTHIDFKMSTKRLLTPEQAKQLVEVYKTAQKPILIHCFSGSDRTGLASALYVAAIANEGEEEAEDQLTPLYGHLSIPIISAMAIDESWESLEPMLGFPNS